MGHNSHREPELHKSSTWPIQRNSSRQPSRCATSLRPPATKSSPTCTVCSSRPPQATATAASPVSLTLWEELSMTHGALRKECPRLMRLRSTLPLLRAPLPSTARNKHPDVTVFQENPQLGLFH